MSLVSLNIASGGRTPAPAGSLISLNLEQPVRTAGFESSAPTGASLSDLASMEQFFTGVLTHSGQFVTPEKARRCAGVLACIRGISEDTAALPLEVFKNGPNGPEQNRDHPLHRILSIAPNDVMVPVEMREKMIVDQMLWGSFYNLKLEDPDNPGVLKGLWPLDPAYIVRRYRELVWDYTDPTTGVSGSFIADDVWRSPILSGNGLDGTAITLLAREAIGTLLAAEEQAGRLFSYGVQTDLQLTTDDVVDETQTNQLRDAFMARHSGSSNSFMPMILQGGLKASRIGLTAQESQFIEAREYQLEDVARVFRYPLVLLGGGSKGKSSSYASAEQFFSSYTKHTLLPWTTRIEQTGHRDLLTTKEQAKFTLRHNYDRLLQADQAARFDNWNKAISGGWMQPAEARRKEGLPYLPGLEYFNRAKNMDSLGGSNEPAPTDQSA